MSGEAGASARSKYFQIYFSSGMTVSVAMPPDVEDNSNYISEYFKEADKPFKEKLSTVLPELDLFFEKAIPQYDLPILPFDGKANHVSGIIIEDTEEYKNSVYDEHQAKNWFSNTKKPKAYLSFSFSTHTFSKITLTITIHKRILRSQLNRIVESVLEIFD